MSARLVCPRFVHPDGTVPAVANVLRAVRVGLVAVPTTPVQMARPLGSERLSVRATGCPFQGRIVSW
jgi:hypothetical protein